MRTKLINFFVVFLFLILIAGIFNTAIFKGRRYHFLSEKNSVRLIPQPGARGRIFDRKGNVIADNRLSYDVMVLAQKDQDLNSVFARLSDVLGIEKDVLNSRYQQDYLAAFIPVVVARDIDLRKAVILEELKMDFPGIIIQSRPQRNYPYGKLACHLLGYLNEIDIWRLKKLADYGYRSGDLVGYGGVEEKYDFYLKQEDGAVSVEVDNKGRFIRILGLKPAQSGKDIELTVDLRIQEIVEECLGTKKGSIVIMDPSDGAIIALVSNPGYDPAIFLAKANSSDVKNLFNNPDAPLMNRAISGLYPLGSVFKPVVASAALEQNKITPSTTYYCPGWLNIGRRKFKCWDTHNEVDLSEAISRSCDVYFYKTGMLVTPEAIHDYALKFGFSKNTGIDIPYESAGVVPDPYAKKKVQSSGWYDGDTANFSIGQGELLVTPIQTARLIAVFANRGMLVTPHLIKQIDGHQIFFYKKYSRINLKKPTLELINSAMRKVVSSPSGTSNVISSVGVSVAGKTGTAQVTGKASHGWFAGFFPYDKPKYVICVMLENGGSGYAASLVTKKIIEEMLKENLI